MHTAQVQVIPMQSLAQAIAEVVEMVCELTGSAEEQVTSDTALMQAGLDSVAVIEFVHLLQERKHIGVDETIVFEFPTPRAVAAHLLHVMKMCDNFSESIIVAPPQDLCKISTESDVLALFGLVARSPGGCIRSPDIVELAMANGDAVGAVPPCARWALHELMDVALLSTVQLNCARHGSFISAAELFDNTAFNISITEAQGMSPEQRLLLELGYTSLHADGYRRVTLLDGDGGVFAGVERSDWLHAQSTGVATSMNSMTGDDHSVASGRLSFALGMQGVCITVDTACSSALSALYAATQAGKVPTRPLALIWMSVASLI